MNTANADATSPDNVRDPLYYYEHGDCVIRVGSTFFKVHTFLLTQDSSAFVEMFSLPQAETTLREGSSDSNPVVLVDDVEEFRALCWVLYALPIETQSIDIKREDIPKVLNVASIAHKYHFISLETWAVNAIAFHCEGGNFYSKTCPSDILERTVQIATLCDRLAICRAVEQVWLDRLYPKTRDNSSPPGIFGARETVPEPESLTVGNALDVGEKYSLHTFVGDVYYQQLKEMHASGGASTSISVKFDPSLSVMQQHRLLYFFSSLAFFWDHYDSTLLDQKRYSNCSSDDHEG